MYGIDVVAAVVVNTGMDTEVNTGNDVVVVGNVIMDIEVKLEICGIDVVVAIVKVGIDTVVVYTVGKDVTDGTKSVVVVAFVVVAFVVVGAFVVVEEGDVPNDFL